MADSWRMKLFLLMIAAILSLTGVVTAGADSVYEGMIEVEGQDYDARVKLRETPNGKIIGQYYSGTHYTADEEKDGWVHVSIGGRSGWMMKSYLLEGDYPTYNAQVGRIAYPDTDGCIELIDLAGKEYRIPANTFLYVLGTIGEMYVHVEAHLQDDQILYGDCIMEKISWSDNFSRATVQSSRVDLPINVRADTNVKSVSVCQLYPGTIVDLIFDYHNSADGWHRVRNGSVSGYIRDDFLDFSTGGEADLIPQWGTLKQRNAFVTGSNVGEVFQSDPLFILGKTGNKKTPLYFCEGRTWVEEQRYETIHFYIQQAFVEESGQGSVSTKAKVAKKEGTQTYRMNSDGEIVPDNELGVIPQGMEVKILSGLNQEGKPTGWSRYLTQDTVWVSCEIPVDGVTYYDWLIPLDALTFDSRMVLPSIWTEG
ncbi:MAG: hypothetical protein IJ708_01295 [Clostridia bacterium]|nr:hypothetical protein [Clostridia bacterium]